MDLEAGNKITSISSYEQACARAEQAATSAMHAAKQLARVAALMIFEDNLISSIELFFDARAFDKKN